MSNDNVVAKLADRVLFIDLFLAFLTIFTHISVIITLIFTAA